MQNNDISNRTSPYIAFDVDSLLYLVEEQESVFDKIINVFRNPVKLFLKRKYNESFTNYLRKLYKETDYNVVLFTRELEEDQLKELADKLDYDFIPFSNLVSYEEQDTLRRYCSGTFTYLFSANEGLLSYISAGNAIHFDKAREVLG